MELIYSLMFLVVAECAKQQVYKPIEVPEDTLVFAIIGNILDTVDHTSLLVDSSTKYTILKQGNPMADLFGMVNTTGDIYVLQPLDRETICDQEQRCLIKLNIAVTTLFRPVQILKADVIITDVNDNSPTFPDSELNISILSDSKPDTKLNIPGAVDKDTGDNSRIVYKMPSSSDLFKLEVGQGLDGVVELFLTLTRELKPDQVSCELTILAEDRGFPPKTGSVIVMVSVLPANIPPVFDRSLYTVNLREDVNINSPVIEVAASARRPGENQTLSYQFDSDTMQKYSHIFSLDSKSGVIFLVHKLDFEDQKLYHLGLEVTDGLSSAQTTVQVTVVDVNDNLPQIFVDYLSGKEEALISESAQVSHFVAAIRVTDADSGVNAQITCQVDTIYFQLISLSQTQFQLVLAKQLDYATSSLHTVILSCQDGGSPQQEVSRDVKIKVIDVNNNSPKFSEDEQTVFIFKSTKVREIVYQVTATDSDQNENGRITYSIEPASQYFSVNPDTGKITYVQPVLHLDIPEIVLVLTARDNGIPSRKTKMAVVIRLTWNTKRELSNEAFFSDDQVVTVKQVNLIIAVIVLLITLVISVVLIACICSLKYKRDKVNTIDESLDDDGRSSPISVISTEPMIPSRKV